MDALLDKIRQGQRRCLAQAMSLVESAGPDAQALKDKLRSTTGNVPWWGFTGPPGVGKSTLIDALVGGLRQRNRRVGVVAVDPTSPFSGGALLGDRIRMMQHAVDQDVFIRSLATHRREGGLSDATLHCARLLEAANFDPVLIETVGVGQSEADIASVADICVVVLGPGYGDDIQLIKAGLLEIADLVVVNKCDMPEAVRLVAEVREEVRLSKPDTPPAEVIGVEAKTGKDVEHLLDKLLELDQAVRGDDRRRALRHKRILAEIRHSTAIGLERALQCGLDDPAVRKLIGELEAGTLSMQEVVAQLVQTLVRELHSEDAGGNK